MPATPPELIDQMKVESVIRQIYDLTDVDLELPDVTHRVKNDLIERLDARRESRLTRYTRTNPKTGAVAGHCNKRQDLLAFLHTLPGFQRAPASL